MQPSRSVSCLKLLNGERHSLAGAFRCWLKDIRCRVHHKPQAICVHVFHVKGSAKSPALDVFIKPRDVALGHNDVRCKPLRHTLALAEQISRLSVAFIELDSVPKLFQICKSEQRDGEVLTEICGFMCKSHVSA